MAYYPDWVASTFPPEKIDFSRFDWIDFAFAVPDENLNLTWDSPPDAAGLLARLVTAAHSSGKKVKLSVGGWTGSRYFSTAVSGPQSRQTLATNILALYQQYSLDGIDIDWEYPGQGGHDDNTVGQNDTSHFLSFLQLLRTDLPPEAKITAAVQTVPFADDQGVPMRNVSEFAEVLDWVVLMNYDTWGSSPSPGPNAPLSNACGNSTQSSANAAAALTAWTSAGFPASQLVLGVPSYGYISRSSASSLRTRARRYKHLRRQNLLNWADSLVSGLAADVGDAPPAVLAANDDGGTDNGQIQFRALVQQGILRPASDGASDNATDAGEPPTPVVASREVHSLYSGNGGFARFWDNCSSTPFLHSAAAGQVITYDDPVSLGLKAAFAAQAGMRGVNMFDVHGDTDQWDLADAIRTGLRLP
ncbi:glycoside hydrolase superfamily [Amylocystis lapponica]|nr:glycoside hydrolase superfamily [Amylocystis lapponica]